MRMDSVGFPAVFAGGGRVIAVRLIAVAGLFLASGCGTFGRHPHGSRERVAIATLGITSENLIPTEGGKPVREVPAEANATTVSLPRLTHGVRVNVTVTVIDKREVDETGLIVSDEGELQLPLLNAVPVRGLTLLEAEERLTALYKKFYRDPQVVLTFTQTGNEEGVSPWGYVTVMGRVMKPGRIALTPSRNLTLSEAIAQAGGLATSARDRSVQITRKAPDGTVTKRTVNLRAIVASGKVEEDVVLQPGDIVFVPESFF